LLHLVNGGYLTFVSKPDRPASGVDLTCTHRDYRGLYRLD